VCTKLDFCCGLAFLFVLDCGIPVVVFMLTHIYISLLAVDCCNSDGLTLVLQYAHMRTYIT